MGDGVNSAILHHHLANDVSALRYITTEMIKLPDDGMNARSSLVEHNAACARWIRETC